MPVEIALSEDAVAVLRFEIKGWPAKNNESRLPAYRELAAAGIMEPVPGSELEYRFTEEGLRRRAPLDPMVAVRRADAIPRDAKFLHSAGEVISPTTDQRE